MESAEQEQEHAWRTARGIHVLISASPLEQRLAHGKYYVNAEQK